MITTEIANIVKFLIKLNQLALQQIGLEMADFWLFRNTVRVHQLISFAANHGWKIMVVGSRFTHSAESRYASIKGEALVVADALDPFYFGM